MHQSLGLASEELHSVFPGRVHTQQGLPSCPDVKEQVFKERRDDGDDVGAEPLTSY